MAWKPGVVLAGLELQPPVIQGIKDALSPAQVMGLTAWAEARSRFERGRWVPNDLSAMVDVLEVIHHRANDPRWQRFSVKGVCFRRWAFSCWEPKGGPDDPHDADDLAENFEALMERAQQLLAGLSPSSKLSNCIAAAEGVLAGALTPTMPSNCCHYYADWMPKPPKWALTPEATIVAHRSGHIFVAGVR
ncbi:MAG: cell wall hydrolase [Steroidobacteraceae bacterium]